MKEHTRMLQIAACNGSGNTLRSSYEFSSLKVTSVLPNLKKASHEIE